MLIMSSRNLIGMGKIKTLQTLKVSSMPNSPHVQKEYLSLYVLEKERHRLMQEILMIDEKRQVLQGKIDMISAKMADYNKKVDQQKGIKPGEDYSIPNR